MMTPAETFNQAWDILVKHAGCRADDLDKEAFTKYYVSEKGTEWRFCGSLGFGGKFWRNDGRYYVTCYPEDSTKSLKRIIEKVNKLLEALPYFPTGWEMTWKLWLDDLVNDPEALDRHCPDGFIAAEGVSQAIELIKAMGMPEFIDFDHDLGDGQDAPALIRWMAMRYGVVPEYAVHSANPVGTENIHSLMNSWKRSLE